MPSSILHPPSSPGLPVDTKTLADTARFYEALLAGIPQPFPPIIEWAEANVHLNGAKGAMYSAAETPWTRLPIELCFQPGTRKVTFVKPTRTGGTAAGHVVLCGWTKTAMGQIQYNWPTDTKAEDIWDKEFEPILDRTLHYRDLLADRFKARKGLVLFPNCSLSVQGVFSEGALDSDTVPYQVNEEIHAWAHGMLAKAYGRGDACDFPIRFNISNAGLEGDQLHTAYKDGTMRQWEVHCPGCKKYHVMRVRWDERHPEHGGLWYDREKSKRGPSDYNYNTVHQTIRYKMPCGHEIPNDITARRTLSDSGRYSDPQNTGALPGEESLTYQAVACHTMNWVDIIKRRNNALAARRTGDEDSYKKYVQEVECEFYSPDKIPFHGNVVTTPTAVKNRTGLPAEAARPFAFDWQQGFKHLGELTHYWGVIESVRQDCSAQVLWAGKVEDENELLLVLKDHHITEECGLADGFIDASKNTKHILSFCYRAGINAVQGNASGKGTWRWPDGTQRYYSPKKYIYREVGMPPKYDLVLVRDPKTGTVIMGEHPDEPYIIMYNKAGLLKNHFYLREMKANVLALTPDATPDQYIERIIPADIGEDYLNHHEAWERDHTALAAKKMGEVEGFKKVRRADHLMSCTTYIDLSKDLSGWLGDQLARLGLQPEAASNNPGGAEVPLRPN